MSTKSHFLSGALTFFMMMGGGGAHGFASPQNSPDAIKKANQNNSKFKKPSKETEEAIIKYEVEFMRAIKERKPIENSLISAEALSEILKKEFPAEVVEEVIESHKKEREELITFIKEEFANGSRMIASPSAGLILCEFYAALGISEILKDLNAQHVENPKEQAEQTIMRLAEEFAKKRLPALKSEALKRFLQSSRDHTPGKKTDLNR